MQNLKGDSGVRLWEKKRSVELTRQAGKVDRRRNKVVVVYHRNQYSTVKQVDGLGHADTMEHSILYSSRDCWCMRYLSQ